MTEIISPYALLKASKPKPPAVVVTPYDLYSAAHAHADPTLNTPPSDPPSVFQSSSRYRAFNPAGRTHYIADIHARHNAVSRGKR